MKKTRVVAALVGLVAVALFAADASAMYNPTMGRFMQRDPGPDAAGPMRLGTAGPAVGGRFAPRDPTGQYADGMNLYQYVKSKPIGSVDPYGLWTKLGVIVFLCRTDQGRNIVSNIDSRELKIWRSEYVKSQFRERADATAAWGPWQDYFWGGMNDANGSHIPMADSDADAALTIVHEVTHAMGGDEMAAYTAETQVGLATPGLSPRSEFVKETDQGKTVDTDAIRTMLTEPASPYTGWYNPAPTKEWKSDADGRQEVLYGAEEQQEDWKCRCPPRFYYPDIMFLPVVGNFI